MAPRFKAAAFDLDGTLLDTSEGIFASVRDTVKKFSLPPISDRELQSFIGPPIQLSFGRHYRLPPERAGELAAEFRRIYLRDNILRARPYDGIFELLAELSRLGIKSAVATYKREGAATELLHHFGFGRYIGVIKGSDDADILKKSDILTAALTESGVSLMSDGVMIGDSESDATGAEAVGVPFIGVSYGFGFKSREDILKFPALLAADSPAEIADFMKGNQSHED